MGAHGVLAFEARRAWRSKMWKYALLVMLAITTLSFALTCLTFWGHDVGELPSAAVAWAGNFQRLNLFPMAVFYFFLIFLLPALAFADSFCLDIRCRAASTVVARTSIVRYVMAGATVSFAAAFLVTLAALLFSQALAFLAFPAAYAPNGFIDALSSAASEADVLAGALDGALFADLYLNHCYALNLLYAAYDALWAGIMAAASFAVSLSMPKRRLVALGLPTLAYLASSVLLPTNLRLVNYLYPGAVVGNQLYAENALQPAFFFLAPVVVFAIVGAVLAYALKGPRDILL